MRRRGRCVCGNPDCDWQPVPGGPGHPPRERDRQQDDTQAWDEEVRRFWTPGARISDPFSTTNQSQSRRSSLSGPVGSFSRNLTLASKSNGQTTELCFDEYNEEAVVVKSYSRDRCYPAAVVAERDALRQVNHPLIASLVRTAKDDARIYIVTSAALGGPLYKHIRAANGFQPERALYYAAQTADALAHCHEWGVLHRDVKASNVVLDGDGRAVLVDFGATGVFDRDRPPGVDGEPKRETYCGTPHAMAPEMVMRSGHGCGVDWWSLGVLLVEMLVDWPFSDDDPAELTRKIRGDRARNWTGLDEGCLGRHRRPADEGNRRSGGFSPKEHVGGTAVFSGVEEDFPRQSAPLRSIGSRAGSTARPTSIRRRPCAAVMMMMIRAGLTIDSPSTRAPGLTTYELPRRPIAARTLVASCLDDTARAFCNMRRHAFETVAQRGHWP